VLLKFEVLEMSGIKLAVQSAKNYQSLRRRGKTVRKTIDCLIATFCILGDHELLHNDRDYDPFEEFLELKVVHP
jgi:predicted nucleic acid-binding protein